MGRKMDLFERYPIIVLERITVNTGTPAERNTTAKEGSRGEGGVPTTVFKCSGENLPTEKVKVENNPIVILPQIVKIEKQITPCDISSSHSELLSSGVRIKNEIHEIVSKIKVEITHSSEIKNNPFHNDSNSSNLDDVIFLPEEILHKEKQVKTSEGASSPHCSQSEVPSYIECNDSLSIETCNSHLTKRQKLHAEPSKLDNNDKAIKIKSLSVVLTDLFPKNSPKSGGMDPNKRSFSLCDQLKLLKWSEGKDEANKFKPNSNDRYFLTGSLHLCPADRQTNLPKHLLKHPPLHLNETASSNVIDSTNICKAPRSTSSEIIVNKEKRFFCAHCMKGFNRKSHIVVHLKAHNKGKRFFCAHCNKGFNRKSQLVTHLRVHNKEKRFFCAHCNEGFSRKSGLVTHLKAHFPDQYPPRRKFPAKQFTCSNCLEKFRLIDELRKHLSRQSCEKSFLCEQCDRKFSQESDFKEHVALHSLGLFCCAHCGSKFSLKSKLEKHVALHLDEMECAQCNSKFKEKCDYEKHLAIHGEGSRFICISCGTEFFQEKDRKRHEASRSCKKGFSCIYCRKDFMQKCDLQDHLSLEPCNRPFCCAHCDKHYNSKPALNLHILKHTPGIQKQLTCEICRRQFLTKRGLKKHSQECIIRKPKNHPKKRNKCLRCVHCNVKFLSAPDFDKHLTVHFGEKRYSCALCDENFKEKGNLVKHLTTSKHSQAKPFSCKNCLKKFRTKSQLLTHETVHSDVKPFACSKCPLAFKTRGDWKKHSTLHSEKRFSCKQCSAKFKRATHLREHYFAIHTDEKPFSCSLCTASFKLKRVLLSHIKRHTGEKQFSCDKCLFKFHTRVELKNHSRVHSDEKKYPCSFCFTGFKTKAALDDHLRTHTGEKPFECTICHCRFYTYSRWKYHFNRHEKKTYTCKLCSALFHSNNELSDHLKNIHKLQPLSLILNASDKYYVKQKH